MSKKIKYTQKELKAPDKFMEFIMDSLDKLSEHFNKIMYAIGGFLVVIILIFIFSNINEKKAAEANVVFEDAFNNYNSGEIEAAIKQFNNIEENFSNLKIANVSRFYLGLIHYEIGNYEESINFLTDYLNNSSTKSILKDSAILTIGLAYFNEENWDKSIEFLNEIEDDSPYTGKAKLHLGLCYEKIGDFEKAEDIYKEILTQEEQLRRSRSLPQLPVNVGIQ